MTPAAGGPGTSDVPARRAALVALAAALDPREFAVTLTTRPGRRLCLSVTSPHAAIGDDVSADAAGHQAPGEGGDMSAARPRSAHRGAAGGSLPTLALCARNDQAMGTMQSVSMSEAARRLLIAQPVG